MAITEAKKAGNKRYLDKFKTVAVRIPLDKLEKVTKAAEAAGESVSGFAARVTIEQAEGTGRTPEVAELVAPGVMDMARTAAEAEGVELDQWLMHAITSKESSERNARGLRASLEQLRRSQNRG